jgi:hypothetical protein
MRPWITSLTQDGSSTARTMVSQGATSGVVTGVSRGFESMRGFDTVSSVPDASP